MSPRTYTVVSARSFCPHSDYCPLVCDLTLTFLKANVVVFIYLPVARLLCSVIAVTTREPRPSSSAGALPLFGLLPIRVTDEASKRAVHAFACRDEPMPLAVDCSPNTKRGSFLVLVVLRPGQTSLSVC